MENIGLKPDCDSVRMLLSFRYPYTCLNTTLLTSLLTTGKTEIGRSVINRVNFGQLCSSGTIPEKIERLIMKVREEVTIGAASFKRGTDMLSSPVALFKGGLLMILKISAQVAGLRIKGRFIGFNRCN